MACHAPCRLLLRLLVTIVVVAVWATSAAADQIFSARIGELTAVEHLRVRGNVNVNVDVFVPGNF